jgi:hypothetical protein
MWRRRLLVALGAKTMTDYEALQKRCQRGATNLNDANNLLADCYGMLGRLVAENEALRREKSEPCDGCFMKDAEALRKDAVIGRIVYLFFDRMDAPAETDPLEKSVGLFLNAVRAAMSKES